MKKALNRVMLVEDEEDIQTIVKMALELVGGYEMHICSNGQQALEALARFKPDLVLLDVMMPGMDGVSTFEQMKQLELAALPPVIFMTAKVQPNEIQGYLNLGAIGVIAKPFDPMTLPLQVLAFWEHS